VRGYRLSDALLQVQALHGAAGRSPLRKADAVPAPSFARVQAARWSAVGEDLQRLPEAAHEVSFVEALGSAGRKRQRMVVREFEVAEAEKPT